jgi:small conductance mechanosensitive channel
MNSHLSALMASGAFHAVVSFFLNILYAIVILLVARFIASATHRQISSVSKRNPKFDDTLFRFLGNIAKYLILAIAVIFVLNRFGIQTTSLVALIGAAGLAIGLALQGTLSNLAAGMMLIFFRPFRVGNYVEAASQAGTVEEISLFYTEMKTYDGLKLIVPNKDIWASPIKNYSANTQRLVDLSIGVSYGSDLKRAAEVLHKVAAQDKRVLVEPGPFIKVKELGDSSVNFAFRVWVASSDWWVTKCEMNEKIKLALDEAGVEIPFPTRTLNFSNSLELVGKQNS